MTEIGRRRIDVQAIKNKYANHSQTLAWIRNVLLALPTMKSYIYTQPFAVHVL
jgi:hypothetical protein